MPGTNSQRAATTGTIPTPRRVGRPSEGDRPLGSIVGRPAASASLAGGDTETSRVVCGNCAGIDTNQLNILLSDGSTVAFVTCHDCSCTGWFGAQGAPLALEEVLARAASRPR